MGLERNCNRQGTPPVRGMAAIKDFCRHEHFHVLVILENLGGILGSFKAVTPVFHSDSKGFGIEDIILEFSGRTFARPKGDRVQVNQCICLFEFTRVLGI